VSPEGLVTADKSLGELAVYSTPRYIKDGRVDIVRTSPYGYPKNIVQLALDAAKSMRSGDDEQTAYYADLLFKAQSSLSLSIAKIGSDQSFIEFNQERLDNNILSLKEMQNILEHPDLGEESTNWKMFEMLYNATLQMSTSAIPMSIFTFMR
jgi:flagellin-like hook-associated protein FlgL